MTRQLLQAGSRYLLPDVFGNNGGMSAPWATSMTPIGPPTSANPTVRQLVYAGIVTGAWSGILSWVVYAIGTLAGVPFEVTTDRGTTSIPWIAFLAVPFIAALAAALLSSLVRGRRHCGKLVWWAGTAIAVASMVGPIMQGVDLPTTVLLGLMHLITWFLVVPQIARIVGDSEPGRSVDRVERAD